MDFFITSCGIPVCVSDSQKGSHTITLLHGYLETMAVWDDFAKLLLPHFRVLRIDLPGHGLSGTNPELNSMDFSAQVVRDVLQKCGISETLIVGHSMGGYVALAFAAAYPDAVRGLALFHSTPKPDSEEKKQQRDREIALIRVGKLDLLIKKSIPHMFAAENIKRFSAKIEEVAVQAEVHDPEGIVASIEGMKMRPDRNAFLASFNKPLLFVFGENDYYFSKEVLHGLAAEFPKAEVLWLKNSGHSGFIEESEIVAQTLVDFTARAIKHI